MHGQKAENLSIHGPSKIRQVQALTRNQTSEKRLYGYSLKITLSYTLDKISLGAFIMKNHTLRATLMY